MKPDLIEWQFHKGSRPEHRGGLPNRFEIALRNLTKEEAASLLQLLDQLQQARTNHQST